MRLASLFCHAMLLNRSPRLADLTAEAFTGTAHEHAGYPYSLREIVYALHRALAALGYCDPPDRPGGRLCAPARGHRPAWADWVVRWYDDLDA